MMILLMIACYLTTMGGKDSIIIAEGVNPEQIPIVPHARTLRKAREQVRLMVIDGFSTPRIKRYLNAWLVWWMRTSQSWHYQTVLLQFIHHCRDRYIAGIAMELLLSNAREIGTPVRLVAGSDCQGTV